MLSQEHASEHSEDQVALPPSLETFLISAKLLPAPHQGRTRRLSDAELAENRASSESGVNKCSQEIQEWARQNGLENRLMVEAVMPMIGVIAVKSSEPILARLKSERPTLVNGYAVDCALQLEDVSISLEGQR